MLTLYIIIGIISFVFIGFGFVLAISQYKEQRNELEATKQSISNLNK